VVSAGILTARPDVMTTRARLFMAVVAMRNLTLGVSVLVAPGFYRVSTRAFDLVDALGGFGFWGWAMTGIGLMAAHAALAESRSWARGAIYASAGIAGVWLASLTMQFITLAHTSGRISPMLPLLWLSLTAKDLVIAWQPMRSPLEHVIRRTAAGALTEKDLDDELVRIEGVIERSQGRSEARGDKD
jgi:hypothetical protein